MRYTDANMGLHKKDDFLVRIRIPTPLQFLLLFLINYGVVCGAWFISDTFVQFAIVVLVMLGILDLVMVWSVQRARDQMLVTEFQNALYSSALSINNQFCIIVRKDGNIVHTDVGFRSMYPQFERMLHRTIDDVFQLANVNKEESERVYQLLTANQPGQQVVHMRDSDGLSHKMVLYVDPIRRPADYLLLRGRLFVENRNSGT